MAHRHNADDQGIDLRIAAQIQLWRERRGLTALELAELAGVHRNTIYRLECGMGCRSSLLVRVMLALKIEVKDFLSDAPRLVHYSAKEKKRRSIAFGTPN